MADANELGAVCVAILCTVVHAAEELSLHSDKLPVGIAPPPLYVGCASGLELPSCDTFQPKWASLLASSADHTI